MKRPRVAAIGLNQAQLDAIRPYCGDLRSAPLIEAYLKEYSWSETDVVVAGQLEQDEIYSGVHLMTIGTMSIGVWRPFGSQRGRRFGELVRMDRRNRERELTVTPQCLLMYRGLAERLTKELSGAEGPPPTATVTDAGELLRQPLVVTTSGKPVALRLQWADRDKGGPQASAGVDIVALFLPSTSDLSQWFRTFLADISEFDPARVPEPPYLLGDLSDWYTPEESSLAERMSQIEGEMARLDRERQQVKEELATATRNAEATIRRAIRQDGSELVDAVSQLLEELGFWVEKMDDRTRPNEAKHEDLRLTLNGRPSWEAIVEVKGYAKGIRTNDASQIRRHREHYVAEKGRPPDLTLWLANPFRRHDPAARPVPDKNVHTNAEIVGTVCMLTTDLYQLWQRVMNGECQAGDAVRQLVEAEPGLWRPSARASSA